MACLICEQQLGCQLDASFDGQLCLQLHVCVQRMSPAKLSEPGSFREAMIRMLAIRMLQLDGFEAGGALLRGPSEGGGHHCFLGTAQGLLAARAPRVCTGCTVLVSQAAWLADTQICVQAPSFKREASSLGRVPTKQGPRCVAFRMARQLAW